MAIGLGTIFVLGFLFFQKVWANQIWLTLRAWPMLTLFIVIGLAIAGTAVLENTRSGELPKIAMVVVGLIAVFAVGILVFTPYFSLRSVDTSNTTLAPKAETAQMAEYKVRPPFVVGSAQVSDNVSINGDPQNTKYIPDSDRFGNLIVKAGVLKGYGEIVWARINESGQATTDSCRFSKDAERRLGGRFSHNLERAILNKDFGVMIDPADSYGYCDDKGTPWVVVPLKKYKGFLAPHQVPAGVAVYNGKTGELSLKKDVATGEIPGPVYPTSLSAYARKATRTADGFWSWITKAAGYAAYSSTKNSSELILQRADDSQTDYVTPLRLIGRGGGIVAVSETSASAVKAGQLNPTQIATLPKYRQGDAAVSDRIRTDYASLEWASGISVFEITPVDAKTWVATLGLRKSIKYRIHIKDDSSSCLYSVSNKLIRCTGDEESPNTEQPPAANPTSDLNTISDAELVELQEQVQREIRKRFLAKNK